ncbi:hypothetical protein HII12_000752 [Brettanomyces bruxellensis]|uniref:Pre-mRNA-splicing factor 18 n=1 Tax=Dekkera bruxellensis TaxID=5007 RepID=A0A8H6EYZ0_DEKBR|nr:hypothetical protein HII12_000752 [Brettanomyces bruxellensis]
MDFEELLQGEINKKKKVIEESQKGREYVKAVDIEEEELREQQQIDELNLEQEQKLHKGSKQHRFEKGNKESDESNFVSYYGVTKAKEKNEQLLNAEIGLRKLKEPIRRYGESDKDLITRYKKFKYGTAENEERIVDENATKSESEDEDKSENNDNSNEDKTGEEDESEKDNSEVVRSENVDKGRNDNENMDKDRNDNDNDHKGICDNESKTEDTDENKSEEKRNYEVEEDDQKEDNNSTDKHTNSPVEKHTELNVDKNKESIKSTGHTKDTDMITSTKPEESDAVIKIEKNDISKNLHKAAMQDALLLETKRWLVPLLVKIKRDELDQDLAITLSTTLYNLQNGKYIEAESNYMELSVGNVAWPIGVASVSIHSRAAQARINGESGGISNIMKDEKMRRWILAVKRVMSFVQRSEKLPLYEK